MKNLITLVGLAILACTTSTAIAQSITFPTGEALPQTINPVVENPFFQENDPMPSLASGAETIVSIASGLWENAATWDCSCVPNGDVDVIISAGTQVLISSNIEVVNLTIQDEADLVASPTNEVTLKLEGDWTNDGDFQRGLSMVQFVSEDLQQISGFSAFNSISKDGNGELLFNGPTDVYGVLFVGTSTMISDGFLAFRSTDVNNQGALAPLMGGQLIGDVTYERAITSTANGWLTMGSAVANATIHDINDDFVTTGFPGSNFPNYNFVSVRTYDETAATSAESFVPVGDINAPMVPGLGYYVYSNAGSFLFDVVGTPVTGVFNFPVSFTDHGLPMQDGLNVLSNPYPAPIDWSKEEVWVKTGMLNAIYIWDVSIGRFRTFSNGYGTNGGSPIIKGGEAFWVLAVDEEPVLRTTELAKAINATPVVNQGDQFLKLVLTGIGRRDETIIAFHDDATTDFDLTLDAFKFTDDGSSSSLATRSTDNISLAINHIPYEDEHISVPIWLASNGAAQGVITLENVPVFDDRCLFIEDLITGEFYPVETTETIEFETAQTPAAARFMLHVTPAITASPVMLQCHDDNSGEAIVAGVGSGTFTYILSDEDGNEVGTVSDVSEEFSFDGLSAGWYSVTIEGIEHCGVLSSELVIEQPEALFASSAHTNIACNETNTGTITVESGGGSGELSYLWNDGFMAADRVELAGGEYTLEITDENGCTLELTVEVEAAPTVDAGFQVNEQVINLQNGEAMINFSNTSSAADQFTWNFGDGSAVSNAENPMHTYTQAGNYIVTLQASNDQCNDTYQMVITVEQGMGIDGQNSLENSVVVYPAEGQTIIRFDHSDVRAYRIDVHNLLGQKVMAPIEGRFGNERLHLNITRDVPAMLVSIINTETGENHTYKILR